MQSHSMMSRFPVARLLVLGVALSPMAMFAQSSAPTDPQGASQDNQGPPSPPHGDRMDPAARDAHMLQHMTKALNLSPDQVTQIQNIQADTRTQAQALRADTSVQGPDRRTKMMDLHKAQNDKVRAVLNDEQRTKFDAMQQRHREHMGDRQNGDEPPPPPPAQ